MTKQKHKNSVGGRRVVTLSYNPEVSDPLWEALDHAMKQADICNTQGNPSITTLVRRLALLAMHDRNNATYMLQELMELTDDFHENYLVNMFASRGKRGENGSAS